MRSCSEDSNTLTRFFIDLVKLVESRIDPKLPITLDFKRSAEELLYAERRWVEIFQPRRYVNASNERPTLGQFMDECCPIFSCSDQWNTPPSGSTTKPNQPNIFEHPSSGVCLFWLTYNYPLRIILNSRKEGYFIAQIDHDSWGIFMIWWRAYKQNQNKTTQNHPQTPEISCKPAGFQANFAVYCGCALTNACELDQRAGIKTSCLLPGCNERSLYSRTV